jgi:hypothetical protein
MKVKDITLIALTVGVMSLPFASCSDYLDVNTNPNYPTNPTLQSLLPSIGASSVAQLGLNGALLGNMWMEYTTQGNSTNQYNAVTAYNLTVSSYNGFWTNAYYNTLPDIRIMLTMAEEEGAWNYWLIGKVMEAYTFHILTDWYGDIPFTQALNPEEYPQPIYDDSRTVVYPGIISLIDEALARESEAKSSSVGLSNEDFFLGGDMDDWVAFAKSLKLKVLMRDFDANRSQIETLVNAGGLLEVDCAMTAFEDATDKGNPFYEYNIRQLNTTENVRACHTFSEFLIRNNDPRIEQYYEPTYYWTSSTDQGTLTLWDKYGALPFGTKPSTDPAADDPVPLVKSSRYKQAYSDPVYLMNAAEAAFMVAEVYARLGDNAKAKTAYDDAVTKAFDRYDYDATDFIAAGGVYEFKDASTDEMMKCIMTQKWVAACKANSWDAFFDRNRTGIPAISSADVVRESNSDPTLADGYELGTLVISGTSTLGTGETPHRLMVPQASSAYNPNAPTAVSIAEPLWWHAD